MKLLKELRAKKGYTQQKIANQLNISQQAYAKYELGLSEPDIGTIKKLAEIFNVSIDYLLEGKTTNSRGVKIPVLGTIPAGIPIEAVEDVLDYEEISEAMARHGEFFALKVRGESMSPIILDGDVVIIRKQEDADSGDICVVMIDGCDATLKEIKKDPNGLWVLPKNPNSEFQPTFYTREEIITVPVRILGIAVEIRRSLR